VGTPQSQAVHATTISIGRQKKGGRIENLVSSKEANEQSDTEGNGKDGRS